jgi:hypothetical protein
VEPASTIGSAVAAYWLSVTAPLVEVVGLVVDDVVGGTDVVVEEEAVVVVAAGGAVVDGTGSATATGTAAA